MFLSTLQGLPSPGYRLLRPFGTAEMERLPRSFISSQFRAQIRVSVADCGFIVSVPSCVTVSRHGKHFHVGGYFWLESGRCTIW